MKPDAVKPLACPFCGNDIVDFITTQGEKWGAVICTDCGAYGPEVRTLYDPKDRWHTEAIKEWNRRTPPAGWKPIETAPPAHKFLMERCWYWVPVIDDESLPPDGWKGVVEAETKRGHIEYRQAEYTKPLFGGKPEWSAWTFREEGDWKPLRWLKKWDIPLLSAAPENDAPRQEGE